MHLYFQIHFFKIKDLLVLLMWPILSKKSGGAWAVARVGCPQPQHGGAHPIGLWPQVHWNHHRWNITMNVITNQQTLFVSKTKFFPMCSMTFKLKLHLPVKLPSGSQSQVRPSPANRAHRRPPPAASLLPLQRPKPFHCRIQPQVRHNPLGRL